MLISDLQKQFKKTIPLSDGFFKLMQETFGFYTKLCHDFFSIFGKHVEASTLGHFLQNDIRPRLFDQEYCKTIEKTKKQFLAENIKLEQFIETNDFIDNSINDLNALKTVSEEIYELLQTHWEFFKYEKSVANNEVLIAFLLEIDRVGIRWDSYLEKYLAISSILKTVGGEVSKKGFTPLTVKYHLTGGINFSIEMANNLNQFFKEAYDFVVKVHGEPEAGLELQISALEVQNAVNCILMVPNGYFESYQKFLSYCSVDVLKRETLLKFVMEVVRLEQGKEIPKITVTNFQKKIAKPLNDLPPEGYFSIEANETEDSVNILAALCSEMDRLEMTYKDMLIGATDRLARNRKQALSEMTSSAIAQTAVKKKVEVKPEKKSDDQAGESTIKIDVKNKEHILHLTS
ncbi:MAG: hypothetical protein HQ517_12925 [SAR324 cluster bacterium]|nr:hypothetical protein [SAR324 cluster bacterium]